MGALRAWSGAESPEKVITSAELQYATNERVIAALISHLAQHIVIGEALRGVADQARRRAIDELNRPSDVMIEFINELTAAGVVNDDVRKMSRARIAHVVAAIKGKGGAVAEAQAPAMPEPDPSLSAAIDAIGYRMEVLARGSGAEKDALEMPYPEVGDLMELAGPEVEWQLALNVYRLRDRKWADRLFDRWSARTGTTLSQAERRAWVFLLAELPLLGEKESMGGGGWYDGITLRLPGEKYAVRLMALDRSEQGLSAAPQSGI